MPPASKDKRARSVTGLQCWYCHGSATRDDLDTQYAKRLFPWLDLDDPEAFVDLCNECMAKAIQKGCAMMEKIVMNRKKS